jgi:hypothetical protein
VTGPYTGVSSGDPVQSRPVLLDATIDDADRGGERWTTSFEVPLRYVQPGETTFIIRMTSTGGETARHTASIPTQDRPFRIDNGDTRAWDNAQLPPETSQDYYDNDIQDGEQSLRLNSRQNTWNELDSYVEENFGKYEGHHWIVRGSKLASDAIDAETEDITGSGGWINVLTPAVKRYVPEVTERMGERKENNLHPGKHTDNQFLTWEATATNSAATTHEAGVVYDWEAQELWVHEPRMFVENTSQEQLRQAVRPFTESIYAGETFRASERDALGLDYNRLMTQVENGRIDKDGREGVQNNVRNSIASIIDSSGNDVPDDEMWNTPYFTPDFGEAVSNDLYNMNNQKMRSLIEIAEAIYAIASKQADYGNVEIDAEGDSVTDAVITANTSEQRRRDVIQSM